MAKDVYTIQVEVQIEGPEYEMKDAAMWDDHFHKNTDREEMENRVKFALNDIGLSVTDSSCRVEVVMTPEEETKIRAEWAAEHAEEDKQRDAVHDLGEKLGIKICTYSMYDRKVGTLYQRLLDNDVLYEGKVRFDYDGGWGDEVEGYVIENPTYQDLWVAADKAVLLSRDTHHVFLESIHAKAVEGDVHVFNMSFGS